MDLKLSGQASAVTGAGTQLDRALQGCPATLGQNRDGPKETS